MRRKCHLIIIQIDLIWVISFWDRGCFGISLVYRHLHVLIEFLLVFNPPFLTVANERLVKIRDLGCQAENFLSFILDLYLLFVDPDLRCSGAGRHFFSPGSRAHCMSLCQRGRHPSVIVRTWGSSHLGFLPSLCTSPVPQASRAGLSCCVKIEEQILPGRDVLTTLEHGLCSYLWQQLRAPFSAGCGVMGAVTTALLGTGIPGPQGLLGACLEPRPRENGKPCSGLQQRALGLAGFPKASELPPPR